MSDDEEPVDMKEQIEERCGMKCTTVMKGDFGMGCSQCF